MAEKNATVRPKELNRLSPEQLNPRVLNLMDYLIMKLSTNKAFKEKLALSFFDTKEKETVEQFRNIIASEQTFTEGDYTYEVTFNKTLPNDPEVTQTKRLIVVKYNKSQQDAQLENSRIATIELFTKHLEGVERHGFDTSFIVISTNEGLFKDTEEAFKKVYEYFGEIFPKPLGI